MENSKPHVLLVEDKEDHVELILNAFESSGGEICLSVVRNFSDARRRLDKFVPDLVIASCVLPDGKGVELLPGKKDRISFPLLILDEVGNTQVAVEVIKQGAVDYRVKTKDTLTRLPVICEKILCEWGHNQTQKLPLSLSNIIRQMPFSVMVTDRGGNIEYVNPKFVQMTGYTLEDSVGRNPRFLKSGKVFPKVYKDMWKTISSGKEWRGGFCNRKRSGELYWESATISPVRNMEGTITHFVAVKEDITEQKKTEEKLFQSEKLKALGIMVSGIAHEFNNILAIIKGYAQFLEMYRRNESELKAGLHMISKASDDGAVLVRRMSDFVTADGSSMWFEAVDINELIKHAIEYLMPKWKIEAHDKGISYHSDTTDLRKVPSVKGSPSELREVLINIINNAFEAMPNGGTISFESWGKGEKVFVSISDTGKGMSEEVQRRLFDPFFTTRMPKGTGLGMSAAYGILKKHHGEIGVESTIGVGSKITLELGSTRKAPHSIITTRSTDEDIRQLYVLVVDSDQESRHDLDEFFTKKEHRVKCVGNINKAVRLFEKENFDLVLLDVSLKWDYTAMELIKYLDSLDEKPIIGLIDDGRDQAEFVIREHLKEEFVIRKPFDFTELSITLHLLFGNSGK